MKLQRENKYNGKTVKSIAAVLLASTILTGCNGIPMDKLDELKQLIPSTETIEINTETPEPTPVSTVNPTPVPTVEPTATPEPTLEPTPEPASIIPSFAKENIEFEDQIALYNIFTLVYKTDQDEIKIIPVLYEIVVYGEDWYSNFYDIYTGDLVFSALVYFLPTDDNLVDECFYEHPSLEKFDLVSVTDLYKYFHTDCPTSTKYFSRDELRNFANMYLDYSMNGGDSSKAFHTIDEYRQFYEDAIPERYRVDSYELFGENDKVMVKGN